MSVQVTTDITDEKKAIAVLGEAVRNPPKEPMDVLKFAVKHFSVSGSITDLVSKYLPNFSGLLPIAGQIFEMFSGFSGPSIGQITLDAIQQVSEQLAAGIEDLKNQMRLESDRAIDIINQASAQVSQEESATRIIASIQEALILAENDAQKEKIFQEYAQAITDARAQFMDEMQATITESQARVNAAYLQIQKILASLSLQMLTDLYNQLTQPESTHSRLVTADAQTRPQTAAQPGAESAFPWALLLVAGGAFYVLSKKIDTQSRAVQVRAWR